ALVSLVGARSAFAVNAGSFLASAWFVTRLQTRSIGRDGQERGRHHLIDAARVLVGDPVLRWCTVLSLTSAFAGMAVEAIAAAYGRGRPGVVTLLAVAAPVGLILAGVIAPHSGSPRRLLRASGLLPLFGGGVGLVFFMAGPAIATGALGFAAVGFAVAVPIPAGPVVGRRLPAGFLGPAFSILQGAALGGQALGAAVGGLLAGIYGARLTAMAACGALCIVGAAASTRLPDSTKPLVEPPSTSRRNSGALEVKGCMRDPTIDKKKRGDRSMSGHPS
ncbi:MAG: MFS transporter, partial [Acidimicrobiales bacterium]